MSKRLVLLLAVTCGAAVGNMYYAQPLLHTIAGALSVSEGTAGFLITATQLGYVVGLVLLVPLGDLLERRRLITRAMLISVLALGVAAAAPSFGVFALSIAAIGITSAVAQIIVPMSSTLAAPRERGRVVGTVMSGLLIGILVARTVSGLLAAALGWRTVYVLAAAMMLVLAATLRVALPEVPPTERLPYRSLLASVLRLVREEPVLRLRMVLGAAAMGCFSVLWTSIAFLLSGPPYHYGNAVIGLFGLAGLAGALVAPVAGRLADRGRGRATTTAMILVMLVSWGLLALGKTSLAWLIVGIAVLDLGVQGLHISNQSAIYALRPEARSRLTTAYMVAYFIGGAALSGATSALYPSEGWVGVCVLGAVTATAAFGVWVLAQVVRGREPIGAYK